MISSRARSRGKTAAAAPARKMSTLRGEASFAMLKCKRSKGRKPLARSSEPATATSAPSSAIGPSTGLPVGGSAEALIVLLRDDALGRGLQVEGGSKQCAGILALGSGEHLGHRPL